MEVRYTGKRQELSESLIRLWRFTPNKNQGCSCPWARARNLNAQSGESSDFLSQRYWLASNFYPAKISQKRKATCLTLGSCQCCLTEARSCFTMGAPEQRRKPLTVLSTLLDVPFSLPRGLSLSFYKTSINCGSVNLSFFLHCSSG